MGWSVYSIFRVEVILIVKWSRGAYMSVYRRSATEDAMQRPKKARGANLKPKVERKKRIPTDNTDGGDTIIHPDIKSTSPHIEPDFEDKVDDNDALSEEFNLPPGVFADLPAHYSAIEVGRRIREARLKMRFSQSVVANFVGMGRTAETNWEAGRASPSLQTINQLAVVLNEDPAYLAYGIRKGPNVVNPDMDDVGCRLVNEVVFGESPTRQRTTNQWALPVSWLKSDLGVIDPSKVIIYRIEAAFQASRYEHGDLVIIDQSSTRPSPPGTFLYWDGIGPAIADITVMPTPSGKSLVARLKGADGNSFETEVDNLAIIGRIRGLWRKA